MLGGGRVGSVLVGEDTLRSRHPDRRHNGRRCGRGRQDRRGSEAVEFILRGRRLRRRFHDRAAGAFHRPAGQFRLPSVLLSAPLARESLRHGLVHSRLLHQIISGPLIQLITVRQAGGHSISRGCF
jgi:hypothetical protein